MRRNHELEDLPERYRQQAEAQLGNPANVLDIPQAVAAEPKSKMNGLETRYSLRLKDHVTRGFIQDWRFEAINLRLADNTFYRPDFLVIGRHGQIEFHETKGFWREDARVKIKVATALFPWFAFWGIQEKNGVFVPERF